MVTRNPDIEEVEVSRGLPFYVDKTTGQIYLLMTQRPNKDNAKREPDHLSTIGGTNQPELADTFPTAEGSELFAWYLVWHLHHELGISIPVSTLIEVANSINVETIDPETPGETKKYIQWSERAFMFELGSMTKYTDLQAQHNQKPPRPIDWFKVEPTSANEVILFAQGKTEVPLRPINGKDPQEGFGREEVAFEQYTTILTAVRMLLERE